MNHLHHSHRARRPGAIALAALAVAVATLSGQPSPLLSDPVFDASTLRRLDLRVHSADWEKLKQNFQENTYYPADFVLNGETVRNIGIRSRGGGSRSGQKPGLRVDFDRYTTDQEYRGLKSLVLDNLTQDPSGVHETVTMKMFARLGVPAPREAHVRLYVNNEYAGVYAVVESIDKSFLARSFGSIGDDVQNDGYLYEYNFVAPWRFDYLGNDLAPYEERFEPETHENASDAELFGPIESLARLVNTLPPDQIVQGLGEHLDLEAFIRYLAAQNFMGQNDGFLGYDGMNNFYLYRLEDSSRHVFIAWDEDNAFVGSDLSLTSRHEENVLVRKLMEVPALRDQYYRVLEEAARMAEEPTEGDGVPWLEGEARRQLDLIFDAMREDAARPYSIEQHEAARAAVINFTRDRPRYVQEQMSAASARRRP